MTTQRILLINEDGTAEVNGVKVRVVPVYPQWKMLCAGADFDTNDENADLGADVAGIYRAMLSAAAIDLSGLPRVPERRPLNERDGIDVCNACWNDALTAIGVKG